MKIREKFLCHYKGCSCHSRCFRQLFNPSFSQLQLQVLRSSRVISLFATLARVTSLDPPDLNVELLPSTQSRLIRI